MLMATISLAEKAKQGQLTEADLEFIGDLDNRDLALRLTNAHLLATHKNNDFDIFIETEDIIKRKREGGEFVGAKAVLDNGYAYNRVEIDCIIFLSDWSQLENTRERRINLLDHFENLYANKWNGIGLCTFQNGIQNTPKDFQNMGKMIIEKFKTQERPLKPLCVIGFYNRTSGSIYGMFDDLYRLSDPWALNVNSVLTIRQMVCTLSKHLPKRVLWAHFCHSEAGLIANEVFTTSSCPLSGVPLKFAQNQLITVSYGAVSPIPYKVKEAINTYSIEDITMCFAMKYLDKFPKPSDLSDEALKILANQIHANPIARGNRTPEMIFAGLKKGTSDLYIDKYPYESKKNGYSVTLVESLGEYGMKIEKDHAFDGKTYQAVLERNIYYLEEKHGFI